MFLNGINYYSDLHHFKPNVLDSMMQKEYIDSFFHMTKLRAFKLEISLDFKDPDH